MEDYIKCEMIGSESPRYLNKLNLPMYTMLSLRVHMVTMLSTVAVFKGGGE